MTDKTDMQREAFDVWLQSLLQNPLAMAYNNALALPVDGQYTEWAWLGWQAAILHLEGNDHG